MPERFPRALAFDPSAAVALALDFFTNPHYATVRTIAAESLRDFGGFLVTVVATRYGAPRILRDLVRAFAPNRLEATLRAQDDRLADLEDHCGELDARNSDLTRENARLHGELDALLEREAPPASPPAANGGTS